MKHYLRENKDGIVKYYYATNEGTVEISEAIYKCNRSSNEKERNQRRKLAQNHVLSFSANAGEEEPITASSLQNKNMEEDVINRIVLEEAIYRLSPILRKVVFSYYWYGYSCKEIGNALKISERTANRYLNKALSMLKKELEEKKDRGEQA